VTLGLLYRRLETDRVTGLREEKLATDLALQDSEPRHRSSPRSWLSSARLRLVLALLGLAAGLGNLALNLTSDAEPPFVFTPYLGLLVGWSFIAGGLIAWSRRAETTERRIGMLMVATGFAWFSAALTRIDEWILPTIGSAVSGLWTCLAICLLLVFPQGRLRSRVDRLVVAAIVVDTIVLQLLVLLFSPTTETGAPNDFVIWPNDGPLRDDDPRQPDVGRVPSRPGGHRTGPVLAFSHRPGDGASRLPRRPRARATRALRDR
jgi:hypothetical protein